MKLILLSLLIFVLLAFAGIIYKLKNPILANQKIKKANQSKEDVIALQIPVQKSRLYADVEFLTQIHPSRNSQNIASLEKSVAYIAEIFESNHLKTEIQAYQTSDGNTYKNVVASYNEKAKTRIVIGAHYDVCDNQAGADDNASAVAGLLELARLVSELKPNLDYRIDFVAYSLEEPPYFATEYMGSYIHAKSLKEQNIKLKAMICLEMIGYFTDEPNSQNYPISALKAIYPTTGNFIAVVSKFGQDSLVRQVKTKMLQNSTIPVYSINAPEAVTGIDFSDHRSYWAFGYDALMITDTSFFRNKNYHQKTDTIETLDFDKMSEVVKGVYTAMLSF